MNYFKWLVKEGWKKYWFTILILITVNYGIASSIEDLKENIFWLIFGIVTIGGFDIGIIYHTYLTYKVYKEEEQKKNSFF